MVFFSGFCAPASTKHADRSLQTSKRGVVPPSVLGEDWLQRASYRQSNVVASLSASKTPRRDQEDSFSSSLLPPHFFEGKLPVQVKRETTGTNERSLPTATEASCSQTGRPHFNLFLLLNLTSVCSETTNLTNWGAFPFFALESLSRLRRNTTSIVFN